jgi:hypothetical protein
MKPLRVAGNHLPIHRYIQANKVLISKIMFEEQQIIALFCG